MSKHANQYALIDKNDLLNKTDVLGQLVNININDQDLMKSGALLYLLPLMILLFGVTSGHYLGLWLKLSTDLTAGFGFMFGLSMIYLWSRTESLNNPLKFRPKVTIL